MAPKAKVEKKKIAKRKRKKKLWKLRFILVDIVDDYKQSFKFSGRKQQLEIYHIDRYMHMKREKSYIRQLVW